MPLMIDSRAGKPNTWTLSLPSTGLNRIQAVETSNELRNAEELTANLRWWALIENFEVASGRVHAMCLYACPFVSIRGSPARIQLTQ